MSTVTLPTGLFVLVLVTTAFVAALLTASVAERLTRVRRAASRASDDRDAPFTPGAVANLHRRVLPARADLR